MSDKKSKNEDKESKNIPNLPFDEALRRMLNTPPPQKESIKEQKKTGK